ncbi:MAG TPA: hypothetical protein VNP72_06130 [Longimicrobium sp.]|nr:hypothetical protein [Longimicrobium sp.]
MLNVRVRPLLTLAAAGILIAIGGCAEQPAGPATPQYTKIALPAGVSFSRGGTDARDVETIGPEGGSLSAGGHTLVFPAGAVAEPTQISMTTVPGFVGVDLQPHGLVFPAGARPQLTLSFRGASVAGFSSFAVGYFGNTGSLDEVFTGAVSLAGGTISARIPHFSGYIQVGH